MWVRFPPSPLVKTMTASEAVFVVLERWSEQTALLALEIEKRNLIERARKMVSWGCNLGQVSDEPRVVADARTRSAASHHFYM